MFIVNPDPTFYETRIRILSPGVKDALGNYTLVRWLYYIKYHISTSNLYWERGRDISQIHIGRGEEIYLKSILGEGEIYISNLYWERGRDISQIHIGRGGEIYLKFSISLLFIEWLPNLELHSNHGSFRRWSNRIRCAHHKCIGNLMSSRHLFTS